MGFIENYKKNRASQKDVENKLVMRLKHFGKATYVFYTILLISSIGLLTTGLRSLDILLTDGTLKYIALPLIVTYWFYTNKKWSPIINRKDETATKQQIGRIALTTVFLFDVTCNILFDIFITDLELMKRSTALSLGIFFGEYVLIRMFFFEIIEVFHKGFEDNIDKIKKAHKKWRTVLLLIFIVAVGNLFAIINNVEAFMNVEKFILPFIIYAMAMILLFATIFLSTKALKNNEAVDSIAPSLLKATGFTCLVSSITLFAVGMYPSASKGIEQLLIKTFAFNTSAELISVFLVFWFLIYIPNKKEG